MSIHCRHGSMLAAVAALGLGLVGCRKSQDEKVTVASTERATDPVVDEDYRFRIAWPGKGWKLAGERDIRQIIPDALAGAFSD